MIKRIAASVIIVSLASASMAYAGGKDKAKPVKPAKAATVEGYAVISPIFGQLVSFTLPGEFRTVSENGNRKNYLREAVLAGETLNRWTQMVTVTGAMGLASDPEITPAGFAGYIAQGFKNSCPDSFNVQVIQEGKLNRRWDLLAAVVSCGSSPDTGLSESALIMIIKGERDYYTIQWAERSTPSSSPIPVNKAKWNGRLTKLLPINLCPIVPGEAAPYPSCLKTKAD